MRGEPRQMVVYKAKGKYKIVGDHIMTFRIKLNDLTAAEEVLDKSPYITIHKRELVTDEYVFSCKVNAKTEHGIIGLVDELNRVCSTKDVVHAKERN